ncbi:MAG TPA: hypothetical protein PKW95_08705 [bacterium]|nr:hypothetical protein [bacterium]
MNQQGQNRRRRYFIDKQFQSKYVALLVVFIVALGAAGILILMVGGNEPVPADSAQSDLNGAIIAMLMVILVFVAFTIWSGVRFSHRVVGPVYAFNRHMNWIKEGNYTRNLQLREKDEFKNLAASLNSMQEALRSRVRDDIETLNNIETGLGELIDVLGQDGFDHERAMEMIKRLRGEAESTRVKNEGYITK